MVDMNLLEKYADVAVRVGVGLTEGDRLLVRSSVEALELTRLVVEAAYAAGAVNVDVIWSDDSVTRSRFEVGTAAASETVASSSNFLKSAYDSGDLFLTIFASDPDALAGVDVGRVAGFNKINTAAIEDYVKAIATMERNWSIVAAPTGSWASKVYPEETEADAVEMLWGAIFRACRIDRDDPVAAWHNHLDELNRRCAYLNGRKFEELRYEGPGTDLVVALAQPHNWQGGSVTSTGGREFAPNIPTEEVFGTPNRMSAEGVVTATKPLSLYGNLIDGLVFEFENGAVVNARAATGQDVLDELLDTDEGATRLGELAMVPMSSGVAKEQLVWNNTLYDENDGCHIALGRAYPTGVDNGANMDPEALDAAGINVSAVHVDFVVGSSDLSVWGTRTDGSWESIIENGEWGFET